MVGRHRKTAASRHRPYADIRRCPILRLKGVDDPERASDKSGQFLRVNLIGHRVGHVLAVVILAGVAVDLVEFVIQILGGMLITALAYLPDDLS